MDQYGVEDTVFCEVDITIFYNFIRTTKFAHMNGHWKDYDLFAELRILLIKNKKNRSPSSDRSCVQTL